MNTDKLRLIMKVFINAQFGYCPLVWMFHSRTLNNRINKLHERALRIVFKNNNATFDDLLKLDGSVTVHDRNIQTMAIELFQVIKGLSPLIMNEVFQLTESSNYYSSFPFKTRDVVLGLLLFWAQKYGPLYLMTVKEQLLYMNLRVK